MFGRIAQLVELLSYTQAVIGSSPFAPNVCLSLAEVVQWLEHWLVTPEVAGSSPVFRVLLFIPKKILP